MKIHATPGDIHIFTGNPAITYIAECAECGEKVWQTPQREFVTPEKRDIWAAGHAEQWGHAVARSMWVVARND